MRWRPKVWHASLDRSREQPRFFSYSEPTVTTKSTSASQGGPVDPVWYPLDLADCSLEPTARRGGVESSHDSPLEGDGFELPVPRAIQSRLKAKIAGFGCMPSIIWGCRFRAR